MDESLLDLSSVCLVCLRAEQEYCCIFANDKDTPEMRIVDKIIACSSLVLPQKIIQRVPDKICDDCLSELGATWRFRKKCEAANQVFQLLQRHEIQIEELPNELLEEHKLKLPSGIKVRRIHLTLKLPTKAEALRLQEPKQAEEVPDKPDEKGDLSPAMSARLETDYDIDQQVLVLTSSATSSPSPSPAMQTEVFEEQDEADGETLHNTDAASKEDSICGPQVEYVYDAVEYFDDEFKDELPITMPKSKITCRHNVDAIDSRLSVESSESLPRWTDQDQQETIKLEPLEDSNEVQPTAAKAKPGAGSKAANRRKSTADGAGAAAQQHKHVAAIKSERLSTKCARPSKICDVCGNTYKYQHALDAHMRRHNNERPYPCEVCNKAFVSNVELRRHMRVHTGQKPYGCKFCDRRFSDFGSSKKHERIHTGERPYVCDVCNKGFAYAHVLTVHKRTHTGEKQFPCTHCDKGFTKKAYLLAHIERHKRSKHVPYIVKDLELNSTDFGLRRLTVNNDVLLPSKNGNYDIDDDEDAMDDDDDDVINDCSNAMNTVVFGDDKVLEECIVTSDFIGDNENLPDDHNVIDVDDITNARITVGIPTTDIVTGVQDVVHASVYPVLLSAHYLDDADQLDDAKFMLQ